MSETNHQPKDYFEHILLPQIGSMPSANLTFFAFGILMQAVELAGILIDGDPFDSPGKSKTRFVKAFDVIFSDSPYRGLSSNFYTDLRCGLAHQLRPKDFLLTEVANNAPKTLHLTAVDPSGTRKILVFEKLFEDFKAGLSNIWGHGDLNSTKMSTDFLTISKPSVAVCKSAESTSPTLSGAGIPSGPSHGYSVYTSPYPAPSSTAPPSAPPCSTGP